MFAIFTLTSNVDSVIACCHVSCRFVSMLSTFRVQQPIDRFVFRWAPAAWLDFIGPRADALGSKNVRTPEARGCVIRQSKPSRQTFCHSILDSNPRRFPNTLQRCYCCLGRLLDPAVAHFLGRPPCRGSWDERRELGGPGPALLRVRGEGEASGHRRRVPQLPGVCCVLLVCASFVPTGGA